MVTATMNNKYDWGEAVRVITSADSKFLPGNCGSICGMRVADRPDIAEKFSVEIGEIIYIVEFSDGKSLEVPESFLSEM